MVKTARCAVVVFVLVGVFARPALAQSAPAAGSPDPEFAPASEVTLRVQLPFSQYSAWSRDVGVAIGGLSVGGRFAQFLEVEAGGTMNANPCMRGTLLYFRFGFSPSLLKATPDGSHWNIRLPILFGFSHLGGSGHGCDYAPDLTIDAPMVNTGIDATHWSASSRVGFNIRLLVGIGPGSVEKKSDYSWGESSSTGGPFGEAGLMIGLALR